MAAPLSAMCRYLGYLGGNGSASGAVARTAAAWWGSSTSTSSSSSISRRGGGSFSSTSGSAAPNKGFTRPGEDMKKPKKTLETLREYPGEPPSSINDRIFGGFEAYQAAKKRGSETPVFDAYGETGDPEMLEKILQLARDCLPARTGPRRHNFMRRQRLREKATRKQHYIMKQQKALAHQRTIDKKKAKKQMHATMISAALADDLAYRREQEQSLSHGDTSGRSSPVALGVSNTKK